VAHYKINNTNRKRRKRGGEKRQMTKSSDVRCATRVEEEGGRLVLKNTIKKMREKRGGGRKTG